MFNFIKKTLTSIYQKVTSSLGRLFAKPIIDTSTLEELEQILLEADTGTQTTKKLIVTLTKQAQNNAITTGADLQQALKAELTALVNLQPYQEDTIDILLLVGINGSGKTSAAGKLAHRYAQLGRSVILVAGDTFRAAAVDQLRIWAERTNSTFIAGKEGQDPASVVYAGLEAHAQQPESLLIIDTAGRLQTKVNLMRELEKMRAIISKKAPNAQVTTLLTIDAMLGQNSFDQAKLFHESTHLDGIILTKMDGTGKGGIVFAIAQIFAIPVAYISFGESVTDLQPFDAHAFVSDLLGA